MKIKNIGSLKLKHILISIFLLISSTLLGNTYYVATTGNDSTNGSLGSPWKTWQKAFNTAVAGDTVYFRGGIYPTTVTNGRGIRYIPASGIGHDGTAENWIVYMNYPGEVPILDCVASQATYDGVFNYGIYIDGTDYVHFKGLQITRTLQYDSNDLPYIFRAQNCNHIKIENMVGSYSGGQVFYLDENYYAEAINCDAHHACDSISGFPGGYGSGFAMGTFTRENSQNFLTGCRAWNIGDQGFALMGPESLTTINNCWAFNNGDVAYPNGDGHGFKIGYWDSESAKEPVVIIKNCIAANNKRDGFAGNEHNYDYVGVYHLNNNVAYNNGRAGFIGYNTASSDAQELKRTLKNNISYGTGVSFNLYTHSNNTWDVSPSVTVTSADFVSLDVTQLDNARKANGSLPDITFGRLFGNSDLIGKGTDVGMSATPDIGIDWASLDEGAPDPIPVTSITVTGTGGATTITTDNGTLQMLATVLPGNATTKTYTWSCINGTGSAIISRAGLLETVTDGTVTVKATANDGSGISGTLVITISNQLIQAIPVYVSSAIANITPSVLEVTYNLTLADTVPAASAFSVLVNSVTRTVSSVSISGTKVLLTLSSPAVYGNVVTVAYTKLATNPLQTAAGGQAAGISAQRVTNNVAAEIPVYVSSAIANITPSVLEVTYNLTLADTVPAASAFSVMVNSVTRTVSSVSISGTKVLLTLSSPAVYGNVVTVAYTKPATNQMQTAAGGQAAGISAQRVTNNVAAEIPVYVSSAIANITPSVLEVTYNLTLADTVPAASAFSVLVNSVARTFSSVSISGTKVLLTLSSPAVYGNVVTVAYTKLATNPLQTAAGGQAAGISAQTVTNNVAAEIPVYVSSAIANITPSVLEVTYNLTLADTVPATSAFSVMVNSVARTVSSVSISGTKVLFTLSSPVIFGNTVTVAYTKPATNPLQTAEGGQAAGISAQTVTNNVAAEIPVYVSSAIANITPSVLEVTYNLTLADTVPATSAFSVMVNSVARTVSSVSISGTKVLFTLSSPVIFGNTVTVAYTKPATNPLQTAEGGQAAGISAQRVTNNVAAEIPVYVSSAIANITPSVLEVTYNLTLADTVPAASAFSVLVNSVTRTVSSVSISGTKVLLTLSSPAVYGNVVTVAYTKPATNPLQTAAGGQAAGISAQRVTNNVAAEIPVYVSSAIANITPSVLEVTYNLTLADTVPATSAFSVLVNSVARTVSSVSISGTRVSLTLSSPVVYSNIVTVAYTKPATNQMQTAAGGQAAGISAQRVTNNVAAEIPVYVSSAIANITPSVLEVTYNLTLADTVPAASAFSVLVNSVTRTVSSVSISGTKVLLTLSSPAVYGNVVTVAYTKPATNPLQTAAGGQAAGISAQRVTNNVAAEIPVYVSSAIANITPSVLEVTYNLTLADTVPAASAFSVMVNSVTRTVSSVSISGTKVLLTLSSPVVYGNVVTVAYTKPATNPLQTAAGGQAAGISAQRVTNNVAAAIPIYVSSAIANTTPSVLEVTYNLTLANIVPAASAFTVQVNSVARTVNTISISGTKVLLTLSSPVVFENTVTVAYTKPATNPLQTAAGGQAASTTTRPVTNNLAAAIPGYVSSAIANATPSILEVTYNSTLANIVPAASAFTVQVNSVARTVNTISISGTKVLLTLSSPVVFENTVTVAYTKPATNPLQTASGGQAASITAQPVTNNLTVGSTGAYYVATTGNNNNAGTKAAPWATWQKAFNTAVAGDTVFFRGGTYPTTVVNGRGVTYNPGASIGHDGTAENWIVYINYPGEVPILDCAASARNNAGGDNVFNYGVKLTGVDYVHIKGLQIKNVDQTGVNTNDFCIGFYSVNSNHLKLENMVISNVDGQAYQNLEAYYLEVINCDAYDCVDTYGANAGQTGGWGTGFQGGSHTFENGYEYYYGCRAWNCSDKGFSYANARGQVITDYCWSFSNGSLNGGGHGWKLGYFEYTTTTPLVIVLTNCIVSSCYTANEISNGISGNEYDPSYVVSKHLYNNVVHNCNSAGFMMRNPANSTTEQENARVLRNNISVLNTYARSLSGGYTSDHNTWDVAMGKTINAADFVDLPADKAEAITMLGGARNADGSLPTITAFHLVGGSDLLGVGTNVGMSATPDLGIDWAYLDEGAPDPTASGGQAASITAQPVTNTVSVGSRVANPVPSGSYPVISFIEPYDGEQLVASEKIDVTIDSYDPDTLISKVEYLINDTRIGESHLAPYSISFDSPTSGSYRITSNAYDKSNEIVNSSSVDVYIEAGTGPMNLYPNPNDGHFSVESLIPLQNGGDIVNIINSTGQTVYQGTWENEENTKQFNLSHLDRGIYILIIKNQGILFTKRFIKN